MATLVQSSVADLEREKDLPDGVIALFVDPWCSACKEAERVLSSVYFEKIRVLRINLVKEVREYDLSPSTSFMDQYSIKTIPTVIVFKDKMIVDHISGFHGRDRYLKCVRYFVS